MAPAPPAYRLVPPSPPKLEPTLHSNGIFSPSLPLFSGRCGNGSNGAGGSNGLFLRSDGLQAGGGGGNSQPHQHQHVSGGIIMTPHFTPQEIAMLLDALNSEELQALPPPPPQVGGTAIASPP